MWCFAKKTLHKSWRMGRCIVMHDEAATHHLPTPFFPYSILQLAKNFDIVLLIYCQASRSALMMNNTMKKKNDQHALDIALILPCLLLTWRLRRFPLGRLGFCFRIIAIDPWFNSGSNLFEEIWVIVSSFKQVLCKFSMKFFLVLWQGL